MGKDGRYGNISLGIRINGNHFDMAVCGIDCNQCSIVRGIFMDGN